MTLLSGPTHVLRIGSAGALAAALLDLLAAEEQQWIADYRDLMIALAPYHDCARRLGVDPAEIFDTVAAGAPPPLRDVVRTFGRRADVQPEGFGFRLVETPDGLEYHSRL